MPPPGNLTRVDVYCRKRWRRVQFLMEAFWSRWKREYIHQLQSRQKLVHKRTNLKAGDIVLIAEENLPRTQWRLGRVTCTLPSSDGLVRKVKLLVGDSSLDDKGRRVNSSTELDRPVHKLVLLLES